MVELISKSACEGRLPLTIGGMSLTEEKPVALTSLMPWRGQEEALAEALEKAHGLSLPVPGRTTGKEGGSLIWFGRGQYLLMGPAPDLALADHAALTDQSDAWAVVKLDGEGSEDVLARLVPIDLRRATFKRGYTTRSQLQHMMASVTRTGPQAFVIMVFRSMAGTLVHDLKTAMEAVAARG